MNECQRLTSESLAYLVDFLKEFGKFTGETSWQELAREILNRFYSNVLSLENYLVSKDSLGAALIQRYNHELVVDFYYLFNSDKEENRLKNFFDYNSNMDRRGWSKGGSSKLDAIPPWVADKESLSKIYRQLSDMAHPNIVSLRLNRRGQDYELKIIREAISLVIFEIFQCLENKPFRDLFPNVDWRGCMVDILRLKTRAMILFTQTKP